MIRYWTLSFIFLIGCASRGNLSEKFNIKSQHIITEVPFIQQSDYQCGPASLAMMMHFSGKEVSTKALAKQAFTPEKKGSLQSDMLSATRRQGMLALPVSNIKKLLKVVDDGHPVLVLQNLGFSWYPRWHYAVVVGYDLASSQMILHSGKKPFFHTYQYTFEKTWQRSNNWGYLIVNPGVIPDSISESAMVKATAHLEALSFLKEAETSYQAILVKWPVSLGALIGLGNIHYRNKDFKQSSLILKDATLAYPDSAESWHNYAIALYANRQMVLAHRAAERAIDLAEGKLLPIYQENLKEVLGRN